MGYRISTLDNLPIIPNINLYVFIIGEHGWKGGYAEIIEKNFNRLAKELGDSGAIIAGNDGFNLGYALDVAINSGKDNIPLGLERFIREGNENGVGLLLLSKHPKELTTSDTALYSPIAELDKNFGGLEVFFSELIKFSKNKNSDFISRFEEQTSKIDTANQIIDLKPNFFGIGINLNSLIDKMKH